MTCRICYEPENLVSVCKCDGSTKWVHIKCIQQWIDISKRKQCELCHGLFEHERLRPPQPFKVSYSETIIVGFFLGGVYTIFVWINMMFHLTWLSIANSVLFNSILIFLCLALTRVRKRTWSLIIAYFTTYAVFNTVMSIVHYDERLIPFYVSDISTVFILLTTDIFGAIFTNDRV